MSLIAGYRWVYLCLALNALLSVSATQGDPWGCLFQVPLIHAGGRDDDARETRLLVGWAIHIDRGLLASEPILTARAIELLELQLKQITEELPADAVVELQKVPLFFSPEYAETGPRAEYHPSAEWLKRHGRDPVMAKGIEFTNIRIFERESIRMPNFALHELAHAYHDRVLERGFQNPDIIRAFKNAKNLGRYESVERWHGPDRENTFERAYALTNPQEYFAETTEAFFCRNDFFPFDRDQLAEYDPEMYALLKKLWGVKDLP